MARSIWERTLITTLAWSSFAWAQQPVTSSCSPTANSACSGRCENTVTVQEPGKRGQRCKVLQHWQTPEGTTAYKVQALDTGEVMTIVESGQASTVPGSTPGRRMQAITMRIFHWGRDNSPPSGTPMPPVALAQSTPAPVTCECRTTAPVVDTSRDTKSFLSSWWKKDAPVVTASTPSSSSPSNVAPGGDKMTSAVKKDQPQDNIVKSSAKEDSKPAEPTDWRKSWGKSEERPAATSTQASRPAESKLDLPTAKQASRSESKLDLATKLPQADTKRPDPLQLPIEYAKRPLNERDGGKPQATPKPLTPASNSSAASNWPASPVSLKGQQVPLGARSVVGNGEAMSGNVRYIPVPIITVPDASRPPMPPPQAPMLVRPRNDLAGYYPVNKAPAPSPTSTDPAIMNAFTTPPTNEAVARMTNAFGAPDQGSSNAMAPGAANQALNPNALMAQMPYSPQAYGPMPQAMARYQGMPASNPTMMVSYVQPAQPATANAGQEVASQQLTHLTSLMRDSLYPSQREWAAEGLSQLDWRTHPQVTQALLRTAQEDPAPTVRATCIRCMAKMHMNSLPVMNALQTMKADTDERVRHEADEALNALSPGQSSNGKSAAPTFGNGARY